MITPQPRYLEQVRSRVERLDHAESGAGLRLYVYRVKNRKASDLAQVLGTILERPETGGEQPVRLAPGAQPVALESPQTPQPLPQVGVAGEEATYAGKEREAVQGLVSDLGRAVAGDTGILFPQSRSIRVIGDALNNSIAVMATGPE